MMLAGFLRLGYGEFPGDLGLIVIDDLPEMIGWMKGEKKGVTSWGR